MEFDFTISIKRATDDSYYWEIRKNFTSGADDFWSGTSGNRDALKEHVVIQLQEWFRED